MFLPGGVMGRARGAAGGTVAQVAHLGGGEVAPLARLQVAQAERANALAQ